MVKIVDKYVQRLDKEAEDERNLKLFDLTRSIVNLESDVGFSQATGQLEIHIGSPPQLFIYPNKKIAHLMNAERSYVNTELAFNILEAYETLPGEGIWTLERYNLNL